MAHDFKRFPELTNRQMNLYYFESPHKQITQDFVAKVVKVTDGDTIRVKWEDRDFDFPIRFIDIAAPELDEIGGAKSQSWLESEILGEEVTVVMDRKNRVEKWGRLLGRILFRGIDINQASMNGGFSIRFE